MNQLESILRTIEEQSASGEPLLPDPVRRAAVIREMDSYTEHVVVCRGKHISAARVKSMVRRGVMRAVKNADRVIEMKASTATPDRMGDIVRQAWELANYRENPVILWSHDGAHPDCIMGRSVREALVKGNLHIWVEFATADLNPQADLKFKMYRDGFLKAGSVGFNPIKINEVKDPAEREAMGLGPWGVEFERSELLEFSLCSVPANPDAVLQSMQRQGGYSRKELAMARKTLRSVARDEAPEDVTRDETLEDGAPEETKDDLSEMLDLLTSAKDSVVGVEQMLAGVTPEESEDEDEDKMGAEDIQGMRDTLADAMTNLDEAIALIEDGAAEPEEPAEGEEPAEQTESLDDDTIVNIQGFLSSARDSITEVLNALGGETTEEESAPDDATPSENPDAGKSGGVYDSLLDIVEHTKVN